MAKQCPVCTALNDDDAEYCTECGVGFGLPSELGDEPAPAPDAGTSGPEAGPTASPAPAGRPPIGFLDNLRALPAGARWIGLGLVVVLLALAVVNVVGGGGSSTPTTTIPVPPAPEPTPPTTVVTTTEPILTEEDLYRELEAEILRACDEAVADDADPAVQWDPRWSAISTPEALLRSTEDCVAARRADSDTETEDPQGGADADGGETTTTTAP